MCSRVPSWRRGCRKAVTRARVHAPDPVSARLPCRPPVHLAAPPAAGQEGVLAPRPGRLPREGGRREACSRRRGGGAALTSGGQLCGQRGRVNVGFIMESGNQTASLAPLRRGGGGPSWRPRRGAGRAPPLPHRGAEGPPASSALSWNQDAFLSPLPSPRGRVSPPPHPPPPPGLAWPCPSGLLAAALASLDGAGGGRGLRPLPGSQHLLPVAESSHCPAGGLAGLVLGGHQGEGVRCGRRRVPALICGTPARHGLQRGRERPARLCAPPPSPARHGAWDGGSGPLQGAQRPQGRLEAGRTRCGLSLGAHPRPPHPTTPVTPGEPGWPGLPGR